MFGLWQLRQESLVLCLAQQISTVCLSQSLVDVVVRHHDGFLFPPGRVSVLALSDFRQARAGNEPACGAASLPCPVRKVPSLPIEVRIEDADLGNAIDRKVTSSCALPDRFRGGSVVDAIGLLFVLADIGMDPGDLLLGVVAHDRETELRSHLVHGNDQSCWEGSFDDIAWHKLLLANCAW